ncbi:MAG: hypothetical protein ABJD57_07015, partial [Roseibium sp.]
IRTHGTLARSAVFKTAAIDHSATPPAAHPVSRFQADLSSGLEGQQQTVFGKQVWRECAFQKSDRRSGVVGRVWIGGQNLDLNPVAA